MIEYNNCPEKNNNDFNSLIGKIDSCPPEFFNRINNYQSEQEEALFQSYKTFPNIECN